MRRGDRVQSKRSGRVGTVISTERQTAYIEWDSGRPSRSEVPTRLLEVRESNVEPPAREVRDGRW